MDNGSHPLSAGYERKQAASPNFNLSGSRCRRPRAALCSCGVETLKLATRTGQVLDSCRAACSLAGRMPDHLRPLIVEPSTSAKPTFDDLEERIETSSLRETVHKGMKLQLLYRAGRRG